MSRGDDRPVSGAEQDGEAIGGRDHAGRSGRASDARVPHGIRFNRFGFEYAGAVNLPHPKGFCRETQLRREEGPICGDRGGVVSDPE